jgi:hypothetical protein
MSILKFVPLDVWPAAPKGKGRPRPDSRMWGMKCVKNPGRVIWRRNQRKL